MSTRRIGRNEPICAQEADGIKRAMTHLGQRIGQELKLDPAAVTLLRDKFAYLAEAARRQRSRDWTYTALGLCATTAMSLSLSPEEAAALWRLIETEVRHVVHLTQGFVSTGT